MPPRLLSCLALFRMSNHWFMVIQQKPCYPDVCKLPNCFCSGTKIPGNLSVSSIPPIVFISFDGSRSVQSTTSRIRGQFDISPTTLIMASKRYPRRTDRGNIRDEGHSEKMGKREGWRLLRVTGLHTFKSVETWSLKYWKMKASCTSLQCQHRSSWIHPWVSLNSGLSSSLHCGTR